MLLDKGSQIPDDRVGVLMVGLVRPFWRLRSSFCSVVAPPSCRWGVSRLVVHRGVRWAGGRWLLVALPVEACDLDPELLRSGGEFSGECLESSWVDVVEVSGNALCVVSHKSGDEGFHQVA